MAADPPTSRTHHIVTGPTADTRQDPSHLVLADVPVTLFGHPSTPARIELEPRSRGWRTRKAVLPLSMGLAIAPVVALLPPHAPWALVSLATGGVLAHRKWKERYTIRSGEAECPRCEAELPLPEGSRLRIPHAVTCPGCGHEPVVEVSEARIEEGDCEMERAGNDGAGKEHAGNRRCEKEDGGEERSAAPAPPSGD